MGVSVTLREGAGAAFGAVRRLWEGAGRGCGAVGRAQEDPEKL